MDKNINNLYENESKEQELLFVGSDSNLDLHYIEIPRIFVPYKENLGKAIDSVFYSSFFNVVPKSFISNMQSRDVLHKFIVKNSLVSDSII